MLEYIYGIHQPIPKTDSCCPDLVDRNLNLSQVAVLHTSISELGGQSDDVNSTHAFHERQHMTAQCNQRYHHPTQKTSLIYICSTLGLCTFRWSLVIFEPGSNSIGSSLDWSPSSFGDGQTKLILIQCGCQLPCHSGESHVFFSHHLLHMDSLQQIPCIEWNKANGPGNSSGMPSNNEGTLQVTIIGASVHECQHLHTSRLFFEAAEPLLEMDSQGLCSSALYKEYLLKSCKTSTPDLTKDKTTHASGLLRRN